jgi:putative nucleic acid binding protein
MIKIKIKRLSLVTAALVLGACAKTLPEQDRRITVSPPVHKVSTDFLWKEYQADAKAADQKYWGKAVSISGVVTSVVNNAGKPAHVVFDHVDATLLDDQSSQILKVATAGQRVMLKCFCAGLSTTVNLRSCITP